MLSSDAPPFSTPPVPTATDRLRAWWWVKALATTSGMTGFMVLYFQVLNHPRYPVTTMPLIWLDHLIPFLPFTLPFYLSLWVYVSLAPAFLFTREELVSYGAATALLGLIGLGIFYFWPTAVPTADARTIHVRRNGWRPVRTPATGLDTIAAMVSTISSPLAWAGVSPCAVMKKGTPHSNAITLAEKGGRK